MGKLARITHDHFGILERVLTYGQASWVLNKLNSKTEFLHYLWHFLREHVWVGWLQTVDVLQSILSEFDAIKL